MNAPLWVLELAARFWAEAHEVEPFPRSLRRAIARALPVSLVLQPRLSTAAVTAWLQNVRIVCTIGEPDRPLRACLVAQQGQGFIFVDGEDPEDEQRYSVAHELAHFLREYWEPRRLACERLGPQVAEVFDGLRPPTPQERVSALLARVPVGCHVHLMRRDHGRFASRAIEAAERDADLLAYELLAPAEAVAERFSPPHDEQRRPGLIDLLREDFGLPGNQAADYAELLIPSRGCDPLLAKLRLGMR